MKRAHSHGEGSKSFAPLQTKKGRNHNSRDVWPKPNVFWCTSKTRDHQQFLWTEKKTLQRQGLESVFSFGDITILLCRGRRSRSSPVAGGQTPSALASEPKGWRKPTQQPPVSPKKTQNRGQKIFLGSLSYDCMWYLIMSFVLVSQVYIQSELKWTHELGMWSVDSKYPNAYILYAPICC